MAYLSRFGGSTGGYTGGTQYKKPAFDTQQVPSGSSSGMMAPAGGQIPAGNTQQIPSGGTTAGTGATGGTGWTGGMFGNYVNNVTGGGQLTFQDLLNNMGQGGGGTTDKAGAFQDTNNTQQIDPGTAASIGSAGIGTGDVGNSGSLGMNALPSASGNMMADPFADNNFGNTGYSDATNLGQGLIPGPISDTPGSGTDDNGMGPSSEYQDFGDVAGSGTYSMDPQDPMAEAVPEEGFGTPPAPTDDQNTIQERMDEANKYNEIPDQSGSDIPVDDSGNPIIQNKEFNNQQDDRSNIPTTNDPGYEGPSFLDAGDPYTPPDSGSGTGTGTGTGNTGNQWLDEFYKNLLADQEKSWQGIQDLNNAQTQALMRQSQAIQGQMGRAVGGGWGGALSQAWLGGQQQLNQARNEWEQARRNMQMEYLDKKLRAQEAEATRLWNQGEAEKQREFMTQQQINDWVAQGYGKIVNGEYVPNEPGDTEGPTVQEQAKEGQTTWNIPGVGDINFDQGYIDAAHTASQSALSKLKAIGGGNIMTGQQGQWSDGDMEGAMVQAKMVLMVGNQQAGKGTPSESDLLKMALDILQNGQPTLYGDLYIKMYGG